MAHIFDQHVGSAVTCLAFARRSRSGLGTSIFKEFFIICLTLRRSLIALGSADGSVSICSVQPPAVEKVLDARSGPISRLEWCSNNELMVRFSS